MMIVIMVIPAIHQNTLLLGYHNGVIHLRDKEYFGGVVIFTAEQFEKINGYNTEYVGWGMEDDDLYWRCVEKGYYKQEHLTQ